MNPLQPKIFFSSDLHLGDRDCIDFDERPFNSTQHMEDQIVKRFNSVVREWDILYLVGDLGRDILRVLHRFNGIKHCVMGNHDHYGKFSGLEAGFVSVQNMASITLGKNLITVTHCPLRGIFREDVTGMRGAVAGDNWHGESRHQNFSIPDFGQRVHCHGHLHSQPDDRIQGNQIDIGVCGNNFFPVGLKDIESLLAKGLL